MIVIDLNLLVYTFNSSSNKHREAKNCWEGLLNSDQFVGIPWVIYLGFLRLISGRHILEKPYTSKEAMDICREWFALSNVRFLETTQKTRVLLESLIQKYELNGTIISDAAIAASCLEHKAILYSNDTDFLRFEELEVVNPLN